MDDLLCVADHGQACPVDAIFPEDHQVPGEWAGYIAKNAAHFKGAA